MATAMLQVILSAFKQSVQKTDFSFPQIQTKNLLWATKTELPTTMIKFAFYRIAQSEFTVG